MKLFRRFGICAVMGALIVSLSLSSSLANAQHYDPDQELPKPTVLEKRFEKLGRGLSNVFFGLTEIPMTLDHKLKQGKPLTYLLTTAPVMGVARAVVRTGTGVYEVFTFPADRQDNNYETIIEPEYLF